MMWTARKKNTDKCEGCDHLTTFPVACVTCQNLILEQSPQAEQADAAPNDLLVIERKAIAFDWFVKEMMDEELEILMEKGGYKTPLEAIEKAMNGEQEKLISATGDKP